MKNFTKDDLSKYVASLPTNREMALSSSRTCGELFVEGFEDWLNKNAPKTTPLASANNTPKTTPLAIANKFLQDNLQAIAKERLAYWPSLMQSNALYLQASRLFAAVPEVSDPIATVEKRLNSLCLAQVAEGK